MKKHLRMLLYIALVFGLIVLLSNQLATESGKEINELDFITYDNALYSPEELKNLTPEQQAQGHGSWDYSYQDKEFSRYRTNQLILHLEPGVTYGLYSENLTYASRLWVDGKLLATQGTVSDSPEGFVPRTGSILVYFTAGEETEIVLQRSNFNHAKWNIARFYLGTQDVITRQVTNTNFRETVYLGFLAMMGILNLGMFAVLPSRRRYLWFSISSFAATIHLSLQDPKLIMKVFPNLNWYVGYKMEELTLIIMAIFLIIFMIDCFDRPLWKWFDITVISLLVLISVLILILPTTFYTRYSVELAIIFSACGVSYCLLLIIKSVINWKKLQSAQRYYLTGAAVFLLTGVLYILGIGPSHVNLIRIGMILFELTITLTLVMEYADIRNAYLESQHNEEQLRDMNASMAESQKLQENFIGIMNHEMRTPLTVIAGYADLSSSQLQSQPADSDNTDVIRNLELIKQEALRLGRIVDQTGEGAKFSVVSGSIEPVQLKLLMEKARIFCAPICEKRRNTIEFSCPDALTVPCIHDSMLQVFYNLILNGSRHTLGGIIRLSAARDGDDVVIRVADSGEGMDEETRRHAFEKGYTKDGRHGLGLALCKEIIERHGGSIWIEPNRPAGTVILISIPTIQE